jgi:hypothetical protein
MAYQEDIVKGGPAPTCDDYGEKGLESGDDPGVPGYSPPNPSTTVDSIPNSGSE